MSGQIRPKIELGLLNIDKKIFVWRWFRAWWYASNMLLKDVVREAGTNLPCHGPGEWLSFWHVASKQFWFCPWTTLAFFHLKTALLSPPRQAHSQVEALKPGLQHHLSQLMRLWYLSNRRPAKAQVSLRIHAVSLEPLLFAHIQYGSRRKIWPKIRHLAPLDGCVCAFKERVYGGRKVP